MRTKPPNILTRLSGPVKMVIFIAALLWALDLFTANAALTLALNTQNASLNHPTPIPQLLTTVRVPPAQINRTCQLEANYYQPPVYCSTITAFTNYTLPGDFIGYYVINVTYVNDVYNESGYILLAKNANGSVSQSYPSFLSMFTNATDVTKRVIIQTNGFGTPSYKLAFFNTNSSNPATIEVNITKYIEYER